MKRLLALVVFAALAASTHAAPLRVFIRGGAANRGQEVHAHPRFLAEWRTLLAERGMTVDGATDWPTAQQAQNADVIVVYAQDGGDATPEQEKIVDDFVKRGGGLVVIHTGAVGMKNPGWWRGVLGGAWKPGTTKWKEGPMDLYYTENQFLDGGHPITKGASNFHLDDEIYYDMDILPEARVLATSYTPKVKDGKKPAEGGKAHIYDIQPQMWVYEKTAEGGTQPYRAFVTIPGHLHKTFALPQYRAVLLRGIAWAGKRPNLDEFTKPAEIEALTYPPGGPQKPADTLANLEVHPDFTIKLVASEPLISKPMNFDWAPDGSMWVAETPEYPNGRRGMRPDYRGVEWKDHGGIDPTPGVQERKAIDKISKLIDTNGDGVMDKKEIFYEGLDLVTGLVFHQDGVIVTQAPDILWLRDTNADGKADKVETLYTGLGTGDTHAVINNPRWGWDGWIYATHGYSGSNRVRNAKGETMPNIGSGVVRFRPDGSAIEQYSSKGGNTWGLTITGDNRVMWTQPTSGQLLMHTVLPEYALARGKIGNTPSYKVVEPSPKAFPAMSWEQLAYVQIDWVGSFTAAAGTVIYDGGAWPEEYNGDYFTTEPTINVIHHTRLTPDGSSYTAKKLPGRGETEFVRSKDMWWRPIEVRVGPDGAMYVGDFYNQAVIHNDTRGPDHNRVNAAVRPDRDHYFGRIWKIEHKQAKKLAVLDLSKASAADLVKALESPSNSVRMTASRLIAQKANERFGVPDLDLAVRGLLKNRDSETRIAALWTLSRVATKLNLGKEQDQIGALTMNELSTTFSDTNAAVRRNAAQIAEQFNGLPAPWENVPKSIISTAVLIQDTDAQVRLAALRAVAAGQLSDDAAKIVAAWPKFDDDFQRSAAVGAASRNPVAVINAALDAAGSARAPRAVPGAPAENSTPAGEAALPKNGAARAGNEASGGAPDAARGSRALPGTDLAPLVAAVTQNITAPEDAAKLVIAIAGKPAAADPLKRTILDSLAKNVNDAPAMTPELSGALTKLLASGASGSVLPLAAKWDKAGALKGEIAKVTQELRQVLGFADGDEVRLNAARSLLGLRDSDATILPTLFQNLVDGRPAFQRGLIAALGETNDTSVGAALSTAYGKLSADAQPAAFDAILKRADWAGAFLDAMQAKQIDVMALGTANAARLRTYPNQPIAKRAGELLDELNPLAKMKKEAIAKLAPIVEQKGNIANGKTLFATSCAICHKFGEVGADIGPGLTGMGAHGAGELLAAIVDPNAEVDPSFVTWNFESNDGQFVSGIIAAENPAAITVKSLAGVQEVKVANIKTRTNTARSLMPEGFEGIGGEAVRDIIAYMQSVDGGKFRTVDLKDAFTASTARSFYIDDRGRADFDLAKTGTVTVGGVPFNVIAPGKSATGLNVVNLKGGPPDTFARTKMPQRVEAKVGGFTANRLHFLGGVGGWASPWIQDKLPVLSCTVQFTDGSSEKLVFTNGVEFADHNGRHDVPGSQFADGVSRGSQVRWFSKQLKKSAPIASLLLESENNGIAPTLFAITAELADANAKPLAVAAGGAGDRSTDLQSVRLAAVPAADPPVGTTGGRTERISVLQEDAAFKPQFTDPVPQPPAAPVAGGPRVLLVGGGSAHDFVKFFGATDKATLEPQCGWVDFTQNANGVAPILDRIDVLVWSANQPVSAATRKALMDYVNAGKAVIAYHPGTWYAWNNFPQWNNEVVGGGARGHDKFGEFEVTVTNAAHPIMAGVPASFRITDELYWFNADPAATPIDVLATATSTQKPGTYPQVFVVKHPKAKIVGLTLGHDAKAHDLPAFQTLLKNAVAWAAVK